MKITDVQLDEVKMSPTALMQFMSSPEAKGVMIGFEAELCVPNIRGEAEDSEPDYDQDERIPESLDIGDLKDWFSETHSRRDSVWERIESDFMDWSSDKEADWVGDRSHDRAMELAQDNFDQESGVRQFASADGMTDEEIDRMIEEYNRAPGFAHPRNENEYEEKHPLYAKYKEYADQAHDMMIDSVEDYIEEAEDELRDEFWNGSDAPSLGEYFHANGIRYFEGVANEYGLTWPYYTDPEETADAFDVDWVKNNLVDKITDITGFPVKVSTGYHSQPRGAYYIIEEDSSLRPSESEDGAFELVSPPMPGLKALVDLRDVLGMLKNDHGAYTNRSTGLHIGVSLKSQTTNDIDFIKLVLFLGDEYVLNIFGRLSNTYTKSSLDKIKGRLKLLSTDQVTEFLNAMKDGMNGVAEKTFYKRNDERHMSINMRDQYIEFRSMGGPRYMDELDDVIETVLRYVRAMTIAADPNAYKEEYARKLFKLITTGNAKDDVSSARDLWARYTAGMLDKSQLRAQLAGRKEQLSKVQPLPFPKEINKPGQRQMVLPLEQ